MLPDTGRQCRFLEFKKAFSDGLVCLFICPLFGILLFLVSALVSELVNGLHHSLVDYLQLGKDLFRMGYALGVLPACCSAWVLRFSAGPR